MVVLEVGDQLREKGREEESDERRKEIPMDIGGTFSKNL